MGRPRRRSWAVVLVAVALLASGCSGSGESEPDRALLADIGAGSDQLLRLLERPIPTFTALDDPEVDAVMREVAQREAPFMTGREYEVIRAARRRGERETDRMADAYRELHWDIGDLQIDPGRHPKASDGAKGLLAAWNEYVGASGHAIHLLRGAFDQYRFTWVGLGQLLDAARSGDAELFDRRRAEHKTAVLAAADNLRRQTIGDAAERQLLARIQADVDVRNAVDAVNESHPEGVLAKIAGD